MYEDDVVESRSIDVFISNGVVPVLTKVETPYTIYGDTDSAYLRLDEVFDDDADIEEVVTFANKIGSETNKAFPHYMMDVFNVPLDRSQIVETDREVVSDKSLFLSPKKYVMHIVDNEGIRKNKLKVMGLEIKRTDTPKIVRAMLKELVVLLMDGKQYDEIEKFVDDFKIDFFAADPLEVGQPKAIKTLQKYMDTVMEQNGDMKGLPQHARASLIYNALRSLDDPQIRAGDKIKIVYLENNQYDYVAIPADCSKLPAFAADYDVDYKKHWSLVEKKLEIYLKPVGFDKGGRQSAILDSLIVF